jgi:hypothetical protein
MSALMRSNIFAQEKILNSVVGRNPVDVVDFLRVGELPAKIVFHNEHMLENTFSLSVWSSPSVRPVSMCDIGFPSPSEYFLGSLS